MSARLTRPSRMPVRRSPAASAGPATHEPVRPRSVLHRDHPWCSLFRRRRRGQGLLAPPVRARRLVWPAVPGARRTREAAHVHHDDPVTRMLNRWPTVGWPSGSSATASWRYFRGHGYADIATRRRVTEDTVFRVASISKTMTGSRSCSCTSGAWSTRRTGERGTCGRTSSSRPVRSGGRRPCGTCSPTPPDSASWPTPPRVPARLRRERAVGRPLPTLAEFYRSGLRLHAEPAPVSRNNNHGFATLGQLVEDGAESRSRSISASTSSDPSHGRTDLVRSDGSGRAWRPGTRCGLVARTRRRSRDDHGRAASVYSTPADMARYVAALHGRRATVTAGCWSPDAGDDVRAALPPDPRLAGMGLAFFPRRGGVIRSSSTRVCIPGSSPRSSWRPRTASGCWRSPTARGRRCCGCRGSAPGC
jgi:hypothetical protein